MRDETKALIDKANQLLAIWQEQEQANNRMWDEQKVAHNVWIDLMNSETSTLLEIRVAYKRWRALSKHAQEISTHYDVQREWALTRAKAQITLCEDAGLLRSEEEKSYDKEDPNA